MAGGGQGAGADWSRLLAPDQTKTYRPLCPSLLTLQTPQKTYKDTAKRWWLAALMASAFFCAFYGYQGQILILLTDVLRRGNMWTISIKCKEAATGANQYHGALIEVPGLEFQRSNSEENNSSLSCIYLLLTLRKFIDPGIYIIERISGEIKSKHWTIELGLMVKVNTDQSQENTK